MGEGKDRRKRSPCSKSVLMACLAFQFSVQGKNFGVPDGKKIERENQADIMSNEAFPNRVA